MNNKIINSIKGWNFSDKDIYEAINNKRILNPSIDLTNACNLNCPYCYIEDKNSNRKKRKNNELTIDETKNIIDDLHSLGAKTINIVGSGEPTIDPHFEEIISYIFQKGIVIVLFTNGEILANNEELVELLYNSNVSVVIKYNSDNNQIQDLLAGKKGYTTKRNKAVKLLTEKGFNKEIPTRLGFDILALKGNYEELITIHRRCRNDNIFPIIADYIPTGRTDGGFFVGYEALRKYKKNKFINTLKYLEPVTNGERSKLLNGIAQVDNELKIERNNPIAYYSGSKCTQLLGLYIDIEGNIYPCVSKKMYIKNRLLNGVLGNIKRGDSLINIWNNNDYMINVRNEYTGICPFKKKLL